MGMSCQFHASFAFIPSKRASGAHCRGRWAFRTAGVSVENRTMIPAWIRIEFRYYTVWPTLVPPTQTQLQIYHF